MPDENGVLTDGDGRKVTKWLKEHNMRCPMCQGGNLNLVPQLLSKNPTNGKEVQKTGFTFLSLGITCQSCALISYLNAQAVGIV